ncbi:hypothetical protein E2C01_082180 [Portunus trituberculatus]|uniref:Uncharacterized protein n=1 Tax=Portunus trituberculatus TaxID=210409 RepID=A0A5B7IP91_PORTR|nr:hypothetical protein [Portunus trituberculatus]
MRRAVGVAHCGGRAAVAAVMVVVIVVVGLSRKFFPVLVSARLPHLFCLLTWRRRACHRGRVAHSQQLRWWRWCPECLNDSPASSQHQALSHLSPCPSAPYHANTSTSHPLGSNIHFIYLLIFRWMCFRKRAPREASPAKARQPRSGGGLTWE